MTKHVLDRPRVSRNSPVKKAAKVLAKAHPQPATLTLQRRPRLRDDLHRQENFIRVAHHQADIT